MAIISQPDDLSLLGNLKKFIVSSGSQITFKLTDGATVLLEATYEPGVDGRATIDVRDIVESRLAYALLSTNFYEQASIAKTFVATIDGMPVSFRVIRAGVAQLSDTVSNWLRGNFLTWQPTNKRVTYYSPEWLTYYAQEACTIKLKATFPDNTVQNINLGACGAGKAFTCNVQYAVIAGLLGQLYPSYYDVWAEDATGNRLTYIQRYLYDEQKSEQEQWFLFENSLGGLDTFRASGDTDFTGSHDHKISNVDDVSSEYEIDTNRSYNKNTGYLDDYERRWLLDFFPSRKKYIYHNATIRAIVVTQSDVKYSASDLPSSYSFTYRFTSETEAALLNLIRCKESIPAEIIIPNIDSPDFYLPPRLSEYPRVPLHEGVILPAFDPNSEDPTVTTLGAILSAAVFEVFQKIDSGQAGGELVNVLRSTSTEAASDYSVFSSLKTMKEVEKYLKEHGSTEFLSKIKDDTAQGLITFLKGTQFGKDFVPGLTGVGGRITEKGEAELQSLILRSFLEVPELRFNRTEVVVGDMWSSPGAGIIESVDTVNQIVTLKLEDGEYGTIAAGDGCMGIFHSTNKEDNAADDFDDSKGNRAFAGFATSYFRVYEILDSRNRKFSYTLRPISESYPKQYHPQPAMHFAAYNNPDRRDRQTSSYQSRNYQRYLKDMDDWEIGLNNIGAQIGDLSNLRVHGLDMRGTSLYVNNIYISGIIRQFVLEFKNEERVGGKNLLRESDFRFGFRYWGGDGEMVEINLDDHRQSPAAETGEYMMTESGVIIEI